METLDVQRIHHSCFGTLSRFQPYNLQREKHRFQPFALVRPERPSPRPDVLQDISLWPVGPLPDVLYVASLATSVHDEWVRGGADVRT